MAIRSCVEPSIRSSLRPVRFGQLLRGVHKRIVNILKVYIQKKNMQVELMRFRKKKWGGGRIDV